uniref:LisH domain-containing protein n=1 Tax=Timema poppense TaxID=170557 RepID=A0A7R9D7L3_TIMPO|nr:unnamed protein product [Timema poppensis]
MSTYARHDLLSLHPHSEPTLMSGYFSPAHSATPHPLQQAAARLVNTLASLHCGRDYLCSAGCGLVKVLVACLRGDKGIKRDKITSDMIIATLQKLSLRHSQRVTMIELGVVEWLVQSLSAEYTDMRTYTLEYTTALLMNLCLHRQAKERCVPLSKIVLKVLSALLGTELTHAVPYVNGTLYSLLANPLINQEAKKMGLCKVLDHYLQRSEGEMHKQLEYILRLHRGDCQPDQSSVLSEEENEGDDTEAVDLLEEELDTEDPVRTSHGELHGEQLLYQQYRLLFPYHGVVHPSSSLAPSGEVLVRPTTPRLHSSSTRDTPAPQENSPPPTAATSIDLSEESVTLPTTHDSDNLVMESFESEQEKEEEEEDQSESYKSPVTAQTSGGDTEGGTIGYKLESEIGKIEDSFEQSKEPNSSPVSEDGLLSSTLIWGSRSEDISSAKNETSRGQAEGKS